MNVTSIKQQIKRKDRFSIFVDGEYVVSLGQLELINSGLKVGQELGKDDIAQLKQVSEQGNMYDRVLGLIARRPRSEWEVTYYLRRKGCSEELMTQILNRLRQSGYVNDQAFARAWVDNRRLLKSTSRRRLVQELRQKRIDSSIIHEVIAEDETDELEVLRELVAKKRLQTRYQDNLKLMQYLLRQGYSYGDIKAVLNEVN